ncbi:MAG: Sel1 repeat protein [Lysobacteraceae bacterium]|nr:MAG: Sel1 repeat protein [Xanthomonadaceae bacterium]
MKSKLICTSLVLSVVAASALVSEPANGQAIIKHISNSSLAGKPLSRDSFSISALNDAKTLARTGDVDAQYQVGMLNHMRGAYSQAESWYRRAALRNHPLAAYNLGLMYYEGEGVERDYTTAFNWFEKAAEAGSPSAQFQLGLMHFHGQGVSKDPGKEAYWYRRAALGGNAEAQYNLAVLLSKGEGVEEDDVAALAWLAMAVDNGVDAQAQLDESYQRMTTQERQAAAQKRVEFEAMIKRPRYLVGR